MSKRRWRAGLCSATLAAAGVMTAPAAALASPGYSGPPPRPVPGWYYNHDHNQHYQHNRNRYQRNHYQPPSPPPWWHHGPSKPRPPYHAVEPYRGDQYHDR